MKEQEVGEKIVQVVITPGGETTVSTSGGVILSPGVPEILSICLYKGDRYTLGSIVKMDDGDLYMCSRGGSWDKLLTPLPKPRDLAT